METYDIVVIGGGPAGLMAAIAAAKRNRDASVVLLEKGPRPGRKLLTSGAGQCNYTHEGDIEDFLGKFGGGSKMPGDPDEYGIRAVGSAGRFLKHAMYSFSNADLVDFMADRGVPSIIEENGKVFPESKRSLDILNAFTGQAESLGISIFTNVHVTKINNTEAGFAIQAQEDSFAAKSIVIATGGSTYPETGSTGEGWSFARSLGHMIAETGPALSPVYVDHFAWVDCAGISLKKIPVEIRAEGRTVAWNLNDVLITHTGLSGPGIVDASRWMRPGYEIRIPLGCFDRFDDAVSAMSDYARDNPRRLVKNMVTEFCAAERIALKLCQIAGVRDELKTAELPKGVRARLAQGITGESFIIAALGGFNESMASRGGVSLEEVDQKSMQSRLVPGLFFAGEVLDIDGDTGGYNIQAAVSTGWLAGNSAAAFIEERKD